MRQLKPDQKQHVKTMNLQDKAKNLSNIVSIYLEAVTSQKISEVAYQYFLSLEEHADEAERRLITAIRNQIAIKKIKIDSPNNSVFNDSSHVAF
ncbi:MAG: hypothetical protein CL862_05650 [Cyanobium sp. NAT70]|nr:hypothetical protein [Cyanobium sp. NAT70]|tara:strand:- start:5797 stop:6078 length:282 start_codon:yes stop_codon:yes gene_type:complete